MIECLDVCVLMPHPNDIVIRFTQELPGLIRRQKISGQGEKTAQKDSVPLGLEPRTSELLARELRNSSVSLPIGIQDKSLQRSLCLGIYTRFPNLKQSAHKRFLQNCYTDVRLYTADSQFTPIELSLCRPLDTMSLPSPPVAALFLTHFDDIKGQSIIFYTSINNTSPSSARKVM